MGKRRAKQDVLDERERRRVELGLRLFALTIVAWCVLDWDGFKGFWHAEHSYRPDSLVIGLPAFAALMLLVDVVTLARERYRRGSGGR